MTVQGVGVFLKMPPNDTEINRRTLELRVLISIQTSQDKILSCWLFSVLFNFFSDEVNSLSYLTCIKYFGLPISVSCPVDRSVYDEESSLSIGLKGIYISPISLE